MNNDTGSLREKLEHEASEPDDGTRTVTGVVVVHFPFSLDWSKEVPDDEVTYHIQQHIGEQLSVLLEASGIDFDIEGVKLG